MLPQIAWDLVNSFIGFVVTKKEKRDRFWSIYIVLHQSNLNKKDTFFIMSNLDDEFHIEESRVQFLTELADFQTYLNHNWRDAMLWMRYRRVMHRKRASIFFDSGIQPRYLKITERELLPQFLR